MNRLLRWGATAPLCFLAGCLGGQGMVEVPANETQGTGVFLIDKYEGSIRERTKVKAGGATEVIRSAQSRVRVAPTSSLNYLEAEELCEAAGKRICTRKEWLAACTGPRNFKFGPQNSATSPRALNSICALGEAGNNLDLSLSVDASTLLTGTKSLCKAPDVGAFDLVGGLSEWVFDEARDRGVPIGPNAVTVTGWSMCDVEVIGVDSDGDGDIDSPAGEEFNSSNIGFRCCQDL